MGILSKSITILLVVFPTIAHSNLVSLSDAIALAHGINPDIRSLENQIESTSAKSRQALAPTEPSLGINFNDMTHAFSPTLAASTVYSITQPLGFPGKAFVNRAAIHEQSETLSAQLKATQLQVATNVKNAYYQYGLAKKNIQINQEQQALYERLLAIAKRRYESGASTQVDYLNAKLAQYSNMNDLADLQANAKAARAQLNTWLNRPVDADTDVNAIQMISHPEITLNEAQAKMTQNRPEISAASHQLKAAEKTNQLAWMSLLPDFQLTVGSTFYNLPAASPLIGTSGETHTYTAGIQLTLPIWFLFNEREGIVSSARDRATAEANLDSVFYQSKISLQTTLANLEAMKTKVSNYEKSLIPLSKQSLDLALVSYGSGKIDYTTLATTAMAWRSSQRDYFAIVANYLITYAGLGQLLGEDY